MQPLVEQPARIRVSIPCAWSMGASEVPKNELAYCLLNTTSSSRGVTWGQNAARGLPSTMSFITGAFFTHMPPLAKWPGW
ncbi:hypothetical protein D3C87_1856180 [compost metagenome]